MSHRRLWVSATIIAFIIFAGFVFSVPHTRDSVETPVTESREVVPVVALHDAFKKGLHTITGSLLAPNACTVVTARAIMKEDDSNIQKIQVEISLLTDTEVCLQLPTRVHFSTTISAPANLPIVATVNGSVATTTPS